MGFLGALISWLVIGGVVGLIARVVMPGERPMGTLATIVLGVVGALVGGFVGGVLGTTEMSGVLVDPWSVWTIVLSVLGAIFVMFVYVLASKEPR